MANNLRYTWRLYKFSMRYYNKTRNFGLNILLFLIVYYYPSIRVYLLLVRFPLLYSNSDYPYNPL